MIIYVNFSLTLPQMNNLSWQWLSMKARLNCCFFGVDEWRDFRSSSNESLVRNNQREQSRQLCLKKAFHQQTTSFLSLAAWAFHAGPLLKSGVFTLGLKQRN